MVKDYDPKKYVQLPNKTYDSLSLTDLVCHVCQMLGYPPVTLICNHLLCYECYESIKRTGDMVCPTCRKRFGHFDRRRKGNVINVSLKEAILRLFPEEVELKLSGQDDKIAKGKFVCMREKASVCMHIFILKNNERHFSFFI